MQEQEQKPNIIHELKCGICGKVCGTITFPSESEVDLDEVSAGHETLCDEHSPKNPDE